MTTNEALANNEKVVSSGEAKIVERIIRTKGGHR
jgi:hypothetical protein